MEKWLSKKTMMNTYNLVPEGNLKQLLGQRINERSHFSADSLSITIPRYFIRLIGLFHEDEDIYYNSLYEIDDYLKQYENLYLPLKSGCEEKVEYELLKKLSLFFDKLSSFNNVTSSMMVQMLDNSKLLVEFVDPLLNHTLRKQLIFTIDYYLEINKGIVKSDELMQLVSYLVFWTHKYTYNLFEKFDYDGIDCVNPKILFYGNISKEEVCFLIFSSLMGADVIYINTEKDTGFEWLDRNNKFSHKQEFETKSELIPFPTEKRASRVETLTKAASREVETQLGESKNFFKAWQLAEHKVIPLTLKTTYEELFVLSNTEAMYRPEWKVESKKVYLPNIFAKINGVKKNKNQYWKEIWKLLDGENVYFTKKLPMSSEANLVKDYVTYWGSLDAQKRISPEKLLNNNLWTYRNLPLHIQNKLAYGISELCSKSRFISSFNKEEDLKVDIFTQLMNIDSKFLRMIQKFDHPREVPKIVIYNNEQKGTITWQDSILLVFLNMIGFDIFIFNPAGNADIENFVQTKYYDIHRLDEIAFELSYKEKSFISRMFS